MALKLPIDLDERVVEAHLPRVAGKPVEDAEVAAMASAIKTARAEADAIVGLEAAASADRTMTPEAAMLAVADGATKAATRVAARLDTARARATAALAELDRQMSNMPAPKTAVELQLESDIRAALKQMPEKERDDAIAEAFETKNMAVLAAVLRAPSFVTGIGNAKLNILRDRFARQFFPNEHARKAYLSKSLDAFDRAGRSFVNLMKQATGSEKARLVAANKTAREQAVAATQAMANGV